MLQLVADLQPIFWGAKILVELLFWFIVFVQKCQVGPVVFF